jgi:ankyrin repeat protein
MKNFAIRLMVFYLLVAPCNAADTQAKQDSTTKQKSFKNRALVDSVRTRTPPNYRGAPLPEVIRKGEYGENNQHLPKTIVHDEYSRLLFIAVMQENIGAIKALLAKGANVNSLDSRHGSSPLIYSVIHNKVRSLNYLILRGADLDIASLDGKTALHNAALKKDPTLINILLESGASTEIIDNQGMLAIDYFSKQDLENNPYLIARFFYDDIDSSLIYAAKRDLPIAATYFVQKGADVNAKDIGGASSLLYAINNRNKVILSMLLNAGASLQLTVAGKPVHAIEYAKGTGDIELLLILDTVKIRRELEANVQNIKYQIALPTQQPEQKKIALPEIKTLPKQEKIDATPLPKLPEAPAFSAKPVAQEVKIEQKAVEPANKEVYYRPGKAKPGVSKKSAKPVSILPESINN